MATRTRKIRHDDETRAKIQASQLINRLSEHVLGKCEMTATQVTAGLGLLRKVLPDLAASHNTNETTVNYVARMPEVAATVQKWQQQHTPTIQ
jgi:hypothetical protein